MVLVIDDILFFLFTGISEDTFLQAILELAYSEMYDPDVISDIIKENRMLYEFEEITKEEYEKKNAELMDKLKQARRARRMDLEFRADRLAE